MRKLVYLISPNQINKNFYKTLDKVLSFGNTAYFQLRLKNRNKKEILKISKKIRKITKKNKVKFLINDDYPIALRSNIDGCHMGQSDGNIAIARKKLKNKLLGITCHNSKTLAKNALSFKADYLAFGSFYKSKLKPKASRANKNILKWAKKKTRTPLVAIGGINNRNYRKIISYGAKYIAISSFIWDNPKLKPEVAIKEFI